MERKDKTWIIILAVLLALAIAAVILFNCRLNQSKSSLEAVSTSLANAEQENAELTANVDEVTAQLTETQDEKTALEGELDTAKSAEAQTKNDLRAAKAEKETLDAEHAELSENYAAAQETISKLESTSKSYAARVAELEADAAKTAVKSDEAAEAAKTAVNSGEADAAAKTAVKSDEAAEAAKTAVKSGEADEAAKTAVKSDDAAEAAKTAVKSDEAAEVAKTAVKSDETEAAAKTAVKTDAADAEAAANTAVKSDAAEAAAKTAAQTDNAADAEAAAKTAVKTDNADAEAEKSDADVEASNALRDAAAKRNDALKAEIEAAGNIEPLSETENTEIEKLCTNISAIVNADDADKSDEEKVKELETLKGELSAYVSKLEAATETISAKQEELDAALATVAEYGALLESSEADNAALTAELKEAQAHVNELSAEIESAGKGSELALMDELRKAEDLTAALIGERDALAEEKAALEAEYADILEELNAYRYARALSDGEAHSASSFADVIRVDADGVTAHYDFTNDTVSGNSVVLVIRVGDEEIFTSKSLKPGETLTGDFALAKALTAGETEATAITRVFDEDGEFVSSTSVPVKLQIAE